MSPDDPRHGTSGGYIAGCHEVCCWAAKQRYDKRRRLEFHQTGQYRKTPSFRVLRRVRALQAIGWSMPRIAEHCGIHYQHLYMLERHDMVYLSTFEKVSATYEALCMTPPIAATTGERIGLVRARNNAQRRGWAPPLAWTDIDDPDESPADWQYVPATRAETFAELVESQASVSEACRRLDLSPGALEKWCDRAGLRPEFNAMNARERAVFEQRNQWSA